MPLWTVDVSRSVVQLKTLVIEAPTEEEAIAEAGLRAPGEDFSGREKTAEYAVLGCYPKEEDDQMAKAARLARAWLSHFA